MLKSVPVAFCTLAFVAVPPTANPGQQFISAQGKNVAYTTSTSKSTLIKKHAKITLPQPGKFVESYLRHNDDLLSLIKQRSEIPFPIIDSVLNQYGLPLELKYLAVIESELKPSALSRVGARGPWQLMPHTAHVLGLKVNHSTDDRVNYYKSTRAAAKYLRDLHRAFGDWLLVLAAYNGGPAPVYRAIRKSHSRNFWTLQQYLPAESRNHVKKFIATAYYFEGEAAVAKNDQPQNSAPIKDKPETTDEKFHRLMSESARSLKDSNRLDSTALVLSQP